MSWHQETSISESYFCVNCKCFVQGDLKSRTIKNLDEYVKKDERLPMFLTRIRESGAKVFLLTNSEYCFTDKIMTYLFDFPHGARVCKALSQWQIDQFCNCKSSLNTKRGDTLHCEPLTIFHPPRLPLAVQMFILLLLFFQFNMSNKIVTIRTGGWSAF